ncbi:MAG: ABC transporter permease [Burkholderiaceae bacterium]
MMTYLLRRLGYALLILLGVNLITLLLFFKVNTPDDMARQALGGKRVTQTAIARWKQEKGYDLPLLFNAPAPGADKFTQTIFVQKSLPMFWGEFGASDDGRNIGREIRLRMGPSLALAVPVFVLGLLVHIVLAMTMAFFRGTAFDRGAVVFCVVAMSISGLFYIIGGQFLFAKTLSLVPVSGYAPGWAAVRFLLLPVLIGVVAGLGGGARWYRTIFLEEMSRDYVRTARAKGLSETAVLYRHVLRNALIPILTGSVAVIPTLFMGSLIAESFFGIPGLGSYTLEAIQAQDFAIVRAMVFIGTALYIVGLILTDFAYTAADPRIRLE